MNLHGLLVEGIRKSHETALKNKPWKNKVNMMTDENTTVKNWFRGFDNFTTFS